MPNTHEEALDLAFIAKAAEYAAPVRLPSDWVVRIDTHFLGGRRHFYNWEIADIGVLILFRRGGKLVKTKVALLQSKRLYPVEQEYDEAERLDYEIGFARLFHTDSRLDAVVGPRVFAFTDDSTYTALKSKDEQDKAIVAYEKQSGIPVYYLLYHPAHVPYETEIPRVPNGVAEEPVVLGARVLPSQDVRNVTRSKPKGYLPRFGDIKILSPTPSAPTVTPPGWLVEEFVADLAIDCKVGHATERFDDEGLRQLFFNRSGPIAAAIAVTFDAPRGGPGNADRGAIARVV